MYVYDIRQDGDKIIVTDDKQEKFVIAEGISSFIGPDLSGSGKYEYSKEGHFYMWDPKTNTTEMVQ